MASRYDEDTGFLTRHSFDDLALQHLHAASAIAPCLLIVIDLTPLLRMRALLDAREIDWSLAEIARRIRAVMPGKSLVGRGLNELICLIPQITDSSDMVADLARLLDRPYVSDEGRTFDLPCRTLIFTYPMDGFDLEDRHEVGKVVNALIDRNHQVHGARWFWVTPEDVAAIRQWLKIDRLLLDAALQDEFTLVYQPRVDMRDGRIIGAEALLRWTNSEIGEVPPATFIPRAEQTGAIHGLTRWVMRRAANDLAAFVDQVDDFRLSINISTSNIRDHSFPADVCEIFRAAGADPARVDFELTETQLMESHVEASKVLGELKR